MNLSLSILGAIQQQVYIRVDSLCLNSEGPAELTWGCAVYQCYQSMNSAMSCASIISSSSSSYDAERFASTTMLIDGACACCYYCCESLFCLLFCSSSFSCMVVAGPSNVALAADLRFLSSASRRFSSMRRICSSLRPGLLRRAAPYWVRLGCYYVAS